MLIVGQVLRIDPDAAVIREIPESFLGLSFYYDQLAEEIGMNASDYNISAEQAAAFEPLIDQAHASETPFWIQELG